MVNATLREIEVLAKLQHPNIAGYFFSEKKEKQLHIYMELCGGGNLSSKIPQNRGMKPARTAYYLIGILSGLCTSTTAARVLCTAT